MNATKPTLSVKLNFLRSALPAWNFQPYSKDEDCPVIACYPPGGPSFKNWIDLESVCPVIQGSCAAGYIIYN